MIPGVVAYEWDSLVLGCFTGQVVPLMTALLRTTRYAAVAIDRWGASQPLTVTVQPGKR